MAKQLIVSPVVVRAKAPRPVTWGFRALLEQLGGDAVCADEATVGADPNGHGQVLHLSSARLICTDLGRRQRSETWTNPVVSPAKGTFGSRNPLGNRLQDAFGTIRHKAGLYGGSMRNSGQLCQRPPRRDVRRPLSTPDVRRVGWLTRLGSGRFRPRCHLSPVEGEGRKHGWSGAELR